MMTARTSTVVLVCALLLPALPAVAQEPTPPAETKPQSADDDRVKVDAGLTFTKPRGWVVAEPKRGAAAALHLSGDKATQIELRFTELTGDKATSYFSTFHASLTKARLERVSSEAKSFGKVDGRLAEYNVGAKTPRSVLVFEFTTEKGAWLIVAMLDGRSRDTTEKQFEELLASVELE